MRVTQSTLHIQLLNVNLIGERYTRSVFWGSQ